MLGRRAIALDGLRAITIREPNDPLVPLADTSSSPESSTPEQGSAERDERIYQKYLGLANELQYPYHTREEIIEELKDVVLGRDGA